MALVANNGAALETLSLSKIYGITDKTGMAIARHCRRLVNLDLTGCWRVSDATVKALAEACPALKQVVGERWLVGFGFYLFMSCFLKVSGGVCRGI